MIDTLFRGNSRRERWCVAASGDREEREGVFCLSFYLINWLDILIDAVGNVETDWAFETFFDVIER